MFWQNKQKRVIFLKKTCYSLILEQKKLTKADSIFCVGNIKGFKKVVPTIL